MLDHDILKRFHNIVSLIIHVNRISIDEMIYRSLNSISDHILNPNVLKHLACIEVRTGDHVPNHDVIRSLLRWPSENIIDRKIRYEVTGPTGDFLDLLLL